MSVMVGLLEVVARLEVLSEEERRRASREEWKRVEEAGWEVLRRAEGVEVKKEKKEEEEEEEEEVRISWAEEEEQEEEEEEEEEEEVRVGWWKFRGSCGREMELNGNNFFRCPTNRTGFHSKCRACQKEKAVIPKGFKVCRGGCGQVLEENADNFPVSKVSKTGFSTHCRSCHDAGEKKKNGDVA